MRSGWIKLDFEKCIKKVPNTYKVPKKEFLAEGDFPIISQEDSFINGYWNDQSAVFRVEKPIVL